MSASSSLVLSCRTCRMNRRVYHTLTREGRGSISSLAPIPVFDHSKYLYTSPPISEISGQLSQTLTNDFRQYSVGQCRSADVCNFERTSPVLPSQRGSGNIGGHILSAMGAGCFYHKSTKVNDFQPIRRFSVTANLNVLTNITTSASELAAFDRLFCSVVTDVTRGLFPHQELLPAMEWFKKVLLYNVPHGKKNRGLGVVESYRTLVPGATMAKLDKARILGWCVELLQAYFLIADDIMDQSLTRRGRPCWYKQDHVGNIAINDAFYINACVYQLLKKHFRQEPYYTDLLDLFHDVDIRTVLGQGLDLLASPTDGRVDLDAFSMSTYDSIVTWKTAYYTSYLPVALAMHMAGISDRETHKEAQVILLKMGHFFQVQDDYLDCYGDPNITGKIGTDIEDNKCSWLVNRALALASPRQRQILQDNYGRNHPTKVETVKEIYRELDIEGEFREFERTTYDELMKLIKNSGCKLPKKMFFDYAEKLYKRDK